MARAYRRDIDGLRAVAIAAVVAFHLNAAFLPGGFMGVDIFFVVSGFLITGIISREIATGRFSLRTFYVRRVRRIAPALLIVLAITTIVATVVLLPVDLVGYARSLLATLSFVSNIYFWRDIDYFSRIAAEKPLLHTWSLGIEEQFYFFFPPLLIACTRWRPALLPWLVGVITLLSFAATVFAGRIAADLPAFYLLPTRAWELGAGALIVLVPAPPLHSRWVAEAVTLLGAGLVVSSLQGIAPGHSIPVAFPAVIGTSLIISGGTAYRTMAAGLLGQPVAVLLGRASYSLYLWHWPIIVFLGYVLVQPPTGLEQASAVALMLALALLSLRFVELPFRRATMPGRTVVAAATGGTVAVAAAAAGLILAHGLPARLPRAAARINAAVATNYRCPIFDYIDFGASRACVMALPTRRPEDAEIVLLGNSHAQMYAPLVSELIAARGLHGLLIPANGCLPATTINLSADCARVAATNIAATLALPRARTVIIGTTYTNTGPLVDATGRPAAVQGPAGVIEGLAATIARLRAAGKTVILIGPIAEPGWDVASLLSRSLAFGRPLALSLDASYPRFLQTFSPMFARFTGEGVVVVRPDKEQCAGDRCHFLLGGQSLFADDNHLATAALPIFRPAFAAALTAAETRRPPPAPPAD